MTEIPNALKEVRLRIAGWTQIAGSGSFEESMEALEAIVALLDRGELTLDLSVQCFELGTQLSERCQLLLEAAELRITILSAATQYDDENDADPWSEVQDE